MISKTLWRYILKRSHIKNTNQKIHANVTICLFNVVAKLTKLQYTYTPSKNSNRMTYSKLWCLIYILVSKKLISCLTRFDKKCFWVIQMPIRLKNLLSNTMYCAQLNSFFTSGTLLKRLVHWKVCQDKDE